MMRAPLPIFALTAICALFYLAPPFQAEQTPAARQTPAQKKAAAKNTKKKLRRTTAVVTAAQRAAALQKVNQDLIASANLELSQPGALAPVFEQLLRLSGGQSHDPVHILHFGDSHTAADEWTGGLRSEEHTSELQSPC